MRNETELALLFSGVSFRYHPDVPLLEGVDWEVLQGSFLALIGPNGGGKTTLLKLIMGFLEPTRGFLKVFGSSPLEVHPLMGYVPQALHFDRLFPVTALEVVLMGLLSHLPWYGRFSREQKGRALEVLEQVGLGGIGGKPFGDLSVGQRQRVLIARAIVGEPALLLLDEPTASADPSAEEEIYQLLLRLRSQHKPMTLLLVTHDLTPLLQRVDGVVCVQHHVRLLAPRDVCQHVAMGLYQQASSPVGFR